jgi:hypothetical protein
MSHRIVILVKDALPGLDLIAIDRREAGRPWDKAPIYLAKHRDSGVYAGGVYDPVPMPNELRAALTSAGLFVPAA